MTTKYVYFFGYQNTDGNGDMKELLGGKGAGLAEMTKAGILVPPGFTITTDVCRYYYENNSTLPKELDGQIDEAVKKLETLVDKKFGDENDPLLVSVRSGAKVSMPGMMDTILNLGLNDKATIGLAKLTNNERFAYDSYRRFIMMFSDVVLGVEKSIFERKLDEMKENLNIKLDTDLTPENLKELVSIFKNIVKKESGKEFPQNVIDQLHMAKNAVFNSWNNSRAITYRSLNKIPDDIGTAVNIQAMVFGNMGTDSATGVGFTRNPSTGEKEFYGEYLINAQGEDVVAGIRTPNPIANLEKDMPEVFAQLKEITTNLEKHYKDVQDFEFTIQDKKLYMLQTRSGKRTAKAAVKIAVDMVKEGLITKEQAILRVDANSLDKLLHPIIDTNEKFQVIAKGLPASPGAASGRVVFNSEDAIEEAQNTPVILVRLETCPDDIHGMDISEGILTARGGMTSHAAVVARGMGKSCVAGCEELKISYEKQEFKIGDITVKKGDWITLEGGKGEVILGKVKTMPPELTDEFLEFMSWADKYRTLKVRANADIPKDSKTARNFGAEGIGLCRTEHMFFADERIPIVQKMILAKKKEQRQEELNKLLPMQKQDFYGLFKEMEGYAVTIRLIDPPLHEFLPKREELMLEIAIAKERKEDVMTREQLLSRIEELHEFNPMLGHRGCRLGITYPEITEMQATAILSAACELIKNEGKKIVPEIMVPLVGSMDELRNQRDIIDNAAKKVMEKYNMKIDYLVGTMIEVPRAALIADDLAEIADFFSFGTNDLTQMTFGFSRDDAGKFIPYYLEKKIMKEDPFTTLDQKGVGQLVSMAYKKSKSVKKDIKLGICGEHGGDTESVKFCHRIGLDYVSCSPFRVPIARLAAAQAAIENK